MATARVNGVELFYDLAGGGLTRWTQSETGGLNAAGFAEPELIHFPSFDGRSIPAFGRAHP